MADSNDFLAPLVHNVRTQAEALNRAMAEGDAFRHGLAHVIHEILMQQITAFERNLHPDEEIAAYLSSFGQRFLIRIENVSYQNPYLIIFEGRREEDGNRAILVQHTTQLNVLFVALKLKADEARAPRRIGF